MFTTQASVEFGTDISTGARSWNSSRPIDPACLARSDKLYRLGIDIEAAKIMTIGERAEDVFYISDESGAPLDDAAKEQLREKLVAKLGD